MSSMTLGWKEKRAVSHLQPLKGAFMRSASRLVASLLVFLFALSVLIWGQSATTSLRGTVVDVKGAVLPAATVAVTDPQTGYSRSAKTDAEGVYQLLQL